MMHNFKLQGNTKSATRSESEMKKINQLDAERAFSSQKTLLDSFMKDRGFHLYGENAYVRLNAVSVMEYIDLQKEHYGSCTFTANYSLAPLYVEHQFFTLDWGGRLGELICGKDVWWDYANENVAQLSFQNIEQAIDDVLIPWFEDHSTSEKIRSVLLEEKKKREKLGGKLTNKQQAWLDALEDDCDFYEIIQKNMQVLMLPKDMIVE